MSSINDRIILPIPVKEAIYKSPITDGITRIQIKEFVASFPIHTKKSSNGDFYPTSFNIRVVSTIGHEYKLEDLELIAEDQELSERWRSIGKVLEEYKEKKEEFKVDPQKYREYVKKKSARKREE